MEKKPLRPHMATPQAPGKAILRLRQTAPVNPSRSVLRMPKLRLTH